MSPQPLIAGGPVQFDISVRNDGPSGATNVVITDAVPAQVALPVTLSPDPASGNCTIAGRDVSCTFPSLPSGSTAKVRITGTLDPATQGQTLTNTAGATANQPDPDPDDNEDTVTEDIGGKANLIVTKADSPDPVRAGNTLTYTLRVENQGPSVARAVQVTDTLPAALSLDTVPADCATADQDVLCLAGDLAVGGSRTFTLVTTVDPATTSDIENTVRATSTTPDVDGAAAIDTETTDVLAEADLSLTKTDSPDPVRAGEPLTYTLTLRNNGPSAAVNSRDQRHAAGRPDDRVGRARQATAPAPA